MPLPAAHVTPMMQRADAPTFPNGTLQAGRLTLIFRVRHLRKNTILKEHRLILAPTTFQQDTESRTALYYTQGGIVADTPVKTGVGVTYFQISGHTGFHGIPQPPPPPPPMVEHLVPGGPPPTEAPLIAGAAPGVQGPGLPGFASLIDGAAAIKDLEETILSYFFPAASPETREVTKTQDLQLEFLNLLAPVSASDRAGRSGWVIHPHRGLVSVRRDASKPFLYQYQFSFAAVRPLPGAVPDFFAEHLNDPTKTLPRAVSVFDAVAAPRNRRFLGATLPGAQVGSFYTLLTRTRQPLTGLPALLQPVHLSLAQATKFVRDTSAQINLLERTFHEQLLNQFVRPIQTFTRDAAGLANAVSDFVGGVRQRIAHPLYAIDIREEVLDVAHHSVATFKAAGRRLSDALVGTAQPRSVSQPRAGTTTTAGVNDRLTLSFNQEPPVTIALGTQPTGPAIAQTVQDRVRAMTATSPANQSAYRDFVATYDPVEGQYHLVGGTKHSPAAAVTVVSEPDLDLFPNNAARDLGLGLANGGQEHAGTDHVLPALALLCQVDQACTQLQSFPDCFADQLETTDAALAARQTPPPLPTHPGSRMSGGGRGIAAPPPLPSVTPPPTTLPRPTVVGPQRLLQTRITPGDTLQGIAARVGSDWQTLALVNRLTYPFIVEEPTTLRFGRVSQAAPWELTDVTQVWGVDAYQGQRVDITAGRGAGQSRRILRNTATTLVLETSWDVVPTDTSDYAVRSSMNPMVSTGTITSVGTRTLTDTQLQVVAGSQRGLTVVITSGSAAGERRQVTSNDTNTFTLDLPWDVPPAPGDLYAVLGPRPATLRQKVVGDWLSVPQPSADAVLPIRSRLQDTSAITGQRRSTEEQLFGCDALLVNGALQFDPGRGDLVTIAGLPNLRQALVHYINLPIGELEYQPQIGSYIQEELGLTASLPLQNQLLASVERTIKQDPRIAQMQDAQLVTIGGKTTIVLGATAIDGASVERIAIR